MYLPAIIRFTFFAVIFPGLSKLFSELILDFPLYGNLDGTQKKNPDVCRRTKNSKRVNCPNVHVTTTVTY